MTGISVGDYRDPERGLELGELMVRGRPGPGRAARAAVERRGDPRQGLAAAALADEPKVCPHLHVPMQSGDDGVLRDMGRHYTAAEYLDTSRALRAAAPHVNLTTDVIVGFPTEDEAAFERTLDAVDAAGITRVHVFPYSPRPGPAPRRSATGSRRRRRSAAPASCGGTPRSARATTARAKLGTPSSGC